MSHTTEGTAVTFVHDGDYEGTVTIVDRATAARVDVPFCDIRSLVADWVRMQIIRFAENAQDEEVLLRFQPTRIP